MRPLSFSKTAFLICLFGCALAFAAPRKVCDVVSSELITEAMRGNEGAWGQLSKVIRPAVINFLKKRLSLRQQDAEDLTQEAFLTAFLRLSSLNEIEAFQTWIHTIALNLGRSKYRDEAARPSVFTHTFDPKDKTSGYSEPVARESDTNENLRKTLETFGLAGRDAYTYELKEHGLPWKEIAEKTGQSVAQAEATYRRVLKTVELLKALPPLPPFEKELLMAVELRGEPLEEAEARLGLTHIQAVVLLSQARQNVYPKLFSENWLERKLSKLPEVYQGAGRLVFAQGKPLAEAAQILGVDLGTLKSRYARARQLIDFQQTELPQLIEALASPSERTITRLAFVEDYSIKELAETFDLSPEKVETILLKAHENIEALYRQRTGIQRAKLPVALQ